MKRKKINESFEYCRSEKNIYFCDESRRWFKLVVLKKHLGMKMCFSIRLMSVHDLEQEI